LIIALLIAILLVLLLGSDGFVTLIGAALALVFWLIVGALVVCGFYTACEAAGIKPEAAFGILFIASIAGHAVLVGRRH